MRLEISLTGKKAHRHIQSKQNAFRQPKGLWKKVKIKKEKENSINVYSSNAETRKVENLNKPIAGNENWII